MARMAIVSAKSQYGDDDLADVVLADDSDRTKKAHFDLSGITPGTDVAVPIGPSGVGGIAGTLVDAATITWNMAAVQVAKVTIVGDRALDISNFGDAGFYTLDIIQGAGGSHLITNWDGIIWPGGISPVLETAAGARNICYLKSDGTNVWGSYQGYPS